MRGASRTSFAALREQLAAVATSAGSGRRIGDELLAVTGLLDTQHGLRRALSDPGKPAEEKAAVASALLAGKVSQQSVDLVAQAARSRWAGSGDLADAAERLGIEAYAASAEYDGTLDDLEDDLFRFGRLLAAQPELRSALSDPALPAGNKRDLLETLLRGKTGPVAGALLAQLVLRPRGRSVAASLRLGERVAADRRRQLIATVRTAHELGAAQRDRLAQTLTRGYGRQVRLNVIIDPSVLGGISVQIGDDLIDGTAATRLARVNRRLAA